MDGDNILDFLEYKDAKNMIQLPIVDANHKVLEEASRCVEDSALLCENPEIQLNEMRTEVFFLMPDFLVDPTDKDLKFLKKNIELNKINFENLCAQLNEFVKFISTSLNNLNSPSLELKKEINDIITKFENTIKSLCAPLISQTEGMNSIDTTVLTEEQKKELEIDKLSINQEINNFLDESNELNKNYHKLFSMILESIEIICDTINQIPIPVQELQNDVEERISKFEEFLESITEENKNKNFNNILLEIIKFFPTIQNKFEYIKSNAQNKCNILNDQYQKRNKSFHQTKIKVGESIEKLTYKAEKIKYNIINFFKKIDKGIKNVLLGKNTNKKKLNFPK